jgi:adenylate cyclase class 2
MMLKNFLLLLILPPYLLLATLEIETKVLQVNPQQIAERLEKLGAKKVEETQLFVDWFRFPSQEQEWYLRVRSYSDKKVEITWKGKSQVQGISRAHPEINLLVENHVQAKALFESIGLVCYAHQEKYRTSWELGNIHFDLDTYPHMPPYLEIEADSDETIQKMVQQLNLSSHRTSSEGERVLIEKEYGLNWHEMHF